MELDVWFIPFEEDLYVITAPHGEEPMERIKHCSSVSKVYDVLHARGDKIKQVGIMPPEMMGLE